MFRYPLREIPLVWSDVPQDQRRISTFHKSPSDHDPSRGSHKQCKYADRLQTFCRLLEWSHQTYHRDRELQDASMWWLRWTSQRIVAAFLFVGETTVAKLERSWENCAKPKWKQTTRQSKTWRRKPCFWRRSHLAYGLIADQISAPVLAAPTDLLREQIRWSTAPTVLGQTEPAEPPNRTPDPAAPSDLVLLLGTNRMRPGIIEITLLREEKPIPASQRSQLTKTLLWTCKLFQNQTVFSQTFMCRSVGISRICRLKKFQNPTVHAYRSYIARNPHTLSVKK